MAVLAFKPHKSDLVDIHRDIDRLLALTTMLCSEGPHLEMKQAVMNARAIYDRLQDRCGAAAMSPEEESVIDVKMRRVKGRLCFLGERCG